MNEQTGPSERVLTAANTIGYALQQEEIDASREAALAAAQRLEDQGLLGMRSITPQEEAEDAAW